MKNAVNKISNLFQDYNALFKTCATNKRYLNVIFKSYWFLYMNNVNILNQASFFFNVKHNEVYQDCQRGHS